jgi:hypothetical protein
MKRSSLGWSLLGLAVVILAAYILSRGLYVGSTIDVSMRQGEGKFLYSKNCHYLYFTGLRNVTNNSGESPSREGAESMSCAPLGNLD